MTAAQFKNRLMEDASAINSQAQERQRLAANLDLPCPNSDLEYAMEIDAQHWVETGRSQRRSPKTLGRLMISIRNDSRVWRASAQVTLPRTQSWRRLVLGGHHARWPCP